MNVGVVLFSSGFMISFLTFFTISIKGMGVNRIINNIPLSVIENSVIFNGENDYLNGYFDKEVLESNTKNYLNTALKDKVPRYKISFLYFYTDEENQIKLDLTDYPESVQIHVSTCYFQSYECQSYLTFYIGELLV